MSGVTGIRRKENGNRYRNRIPAIFAAAMLGITTAGLSMTAMAESEELLASWQEEGTIKEITAFVKAVTDEEGEDFIPERDRIAVFDLDGTLICEQFPIYVEWMLFAKRVLEDPSFVPTEEMRETCREIILAGREKSIPEEMEDKESRLFGAAFAGLTTEEYREYVESFLDEEADGFDNLKYSEAYFRPMKELVDYLEANDFMVYICSGTDRNLDRVIVSCFTDIPAYRVIGTDYYTEGMDHEDEYYLDYHFEEGEEIVRDDALIIKNVKSSKVVQMEQEIGQKPVLAFGNSTGDTSMLRYVTDRNPYRSAAFCLVPDDDERDYAYPSKTEKLSAMCEENGWYTVSMREDFLTLYGDEVKKNPDNLSFCDRLDAAYERQKEQTDE